MSSEFGQQASIQAPSGMSMVALKVELFGQLTIDGFNNLTNGIEGATDSFGRLVSLVLAGQGHEAETILAQQLVGQFSADIPFVAIHGQVGMFSQQLCANGQISRARRSQLEIQNQSTQTDQQTLKTLELTTMPLHLDPLAQQAATENWSAFNSWMP